MFWLHLEGARMSSIFIYSKCSKQRWLETKCFGIIDGKHRKTKTFWTFWGQMIIRKEQKQPRFSPLTQNKPSPSSSPGPTRRKRNKAQSKHMGGHGKPMTNQLKDPHLLKSKWQRDRRHAPTGWRDTTLTALVSCRHTPAPSGRLVQH